MKYLFSLLIVGFFVTLTPGSDFADTLPVPSITADCWGTGGSGLERGSFSGWSAVATDPTFKSSEGKIELKGSIREHQAYNLMKLPIYSGEQTIQLGHGYSVKLELELSKDTVYGDFLTDSPKFKLAGILFYKDTPVSSARIATNIVSSVPSENSENPILNMEASLTLDNTALRNVLKNPGLLKDDMRDLLIQDPNQAEIVKKFGDADGVVTAANLSCEIVLLWTPTHKNLGS